MATKIQVVGTKFFVVPASADRNSKVFPHVGIRAGDDGKQSGQKKADFIECHWGHATGGSFLNCGNGEIRSGFDMYLGRIYCGKSFPVFFSL